MANWAKLFVVVVSALAFLEYVDARGGRGGGARGGSRSRGSSRSRSSSSLSRTRSSTWWKTAAAVGTVYGLSRYQRRRRYKMDPDREPTRCYNSARRFQENGSLFNEFICPEWDQPDELEYCCGPELQQYCCGFWDDGGRVAGVVIGILIAVTLVIGCIACCCCQARKRRASCKSTTTGTTEMTSYPSSVPTYQPQMAQPPPAYPLNPTDETSQPLMSSSGEKDASGPGFSPYPPTDQPGYPPQPYPPQPYPPPAGFNTGDNPPYPVAPPPPYDNYKQ